MKLTKLSNILIVLALTPHTATARVTSESLAQLEKGCNVIKKSSSSSTNSADGAIRIEYLTYCESKSGDTFIWFEAAALSEKSYRGSQQAPWAEITLRDSDYKVLYEEKNTRLVEIQNCGRYQFHMFKLPTTHNGEVHDFQFMLSGTNGRSCARQSNIMVDVVDMISKSQRCVSGDMESFNETEKSICNLTKDVAKTLI